MKEPLVFIALFCLSVLCSHVNSQAADSCSSNLNNLNAKLPFDTSSFTCQTVWASQSFILRYSQTAPNVWSFVLSAPNTNTYIGIGFSPDGKMVGSSAIVGWITADGSTTMKRYLLRGQLPNLVVPDQGNLQILGNSSSIVLESSRIYMAFQLNTDLPERRLLYAVGPAGRLPLGPGFALTEHDQKVSTALNYASGKKSLPRKHFYSGTTHDVSWEAFPGITHHVSFEASTFPHIIYRQSQTQSTHSNLRKSHGILNMVGWGILIPIGAMVARYMKHWDPMWFYLHTIVQTIGFILGFTGIICGLVLNNLLKANVDKHRGLGIFILVLGCLQVIAFLARPNKDSKARKYWNWYHFTVGRVLIFLAAINIFYGIHLGNAGSGWNVGFGIALAILFIVSVILEIRMWMRK